MPQLRGLGVGGWLPRWHKSLGVGVGVEQGAVVGSLGGGGAGAERAHQATQ